MSLVELRTIRFTCNGCEAVAIVQRSAKSSESPEGWTFREWREEEQDEKGRRAGFVFLHREDFCEKCTKRREGYKYEKML